MSEEIHRFFVITGGPGSGKTTLIEALRAEGFATSTEAGRMIIQEQRSIGGHGLPWIDPPLFAELMLSRELSSYREHSMGTAPVFFDRGVPDIIGYLRMLGLRVPAHLLKAAELYRYDRRVFICPPWPNIFEQDTERKQTMDEAERTCESMVRTYTDCGYELIEVPRAPIAERVSFVLQVTGAVDL